MPAGTMNSIVIGFLLLVSVSGLTGYAMSLPAYVALTTMAVYLIIASIVLHKIPTAPAILLFGLPNKITLLRSGITCLAAGHLVLVAIDGSQGPGLVYLLSIAVLAALALDGLDGYIARRFGPMTEFGARFDMEVDAFLILILSLTAAVSGKLGFWIILAGAMRYAFVAASFIWPWLNDPLFPSLRRKWVCVIQSLSLWLLMLPPIEGAVAVLVGALGLVALTWSFGVDVHWLYRQGTARS